MNNYACFIGRNSLERGGGRMLQLLGYIGIFILGAAFGILIIGLMAANDDQNDGEGEDDADI